MIIGFTGGTFDLFHIGHLNMLKNAKALCDKLVVGVSVDKLIREYKKHDPVIPYEQRAAIVEAIKYVDVVMPQYTLDKNVSWEKIHFDILIMGDDWDLTKYKKFRVVSLPRTKGISTTGLRHDKSE